MKLLLLTIFMIPISLFAEINQDFKDLYATKSWKQIKNKDLNRQKYDYSCGAASLATLLDYYYNLKVREVDVLNGILKNRELSSKTEVELENADFPINFLDLAKYSQSKGFKVVGLKLDITTLSKLKIPVIVHLKVKGYDHFSVYKGIDKNNFVHLADPSVGNLKVKLSKFEKFFYKDADKGRLLALIPFLKEHKENSNLHFLQIQENSDFVYQEIERKMGEL